jgi:phosphomannomutase
MEVSAVVGGEGNGGVILPAVHFGRDATTAAALVATALARAAGVAALAARFRPYRIVKEKVEVDRAAGEDIARAVRGAFPDGDLDETDGTKITWPDRWVHVRMSGTEPVVRLIAEAEREEDASALVARARSALGRS